VHVRGILRRYIERRRPDVVRLRKIGAHRPGRLCATSEAWPRMAVTEAFSRCPRNRCLWPLATTDRRASPTLQDVPVHRPKPPPAQPGGKGLGSVVADVVIDAATGTAGEAGEPCAGRRAAARAGDLELYGVGAPVGDELVGDRVAG